MRGKKSATYVAAVAFIALLAGCGSGKSGGSSSAERSADSQAPGNSSAATASAASTPTPAISLVPLRQRLTAQGADPGYRKLTVDLAIRTSGAAQAIEFPSDEGTLTITEGRSYDAKLGFHGVGATFVYDDAPSDLFGQTSSVGDFWTFTLPEAIPLCGIIHTINPPPEDGSAVTQVLQAEAQIPQETTPSTLAFEGFEPVDLTTKPSQPVKTLCTPDTSNLNPIPTKVVLNPQGAQPKASLDIRAIGPVTFNHNTPSESSATLITSKLQNLDKFGDYEGNLGIYAIDDDGVIRAPYGEFLPREDSTRCLAGFPMGGTVGPSQTSIINACYSYRPGHRVVAIAVLTREQDPTQRVLRVVKN